MKTIIWSISIIVMFVGSPIVFDYVVKEDKAIASETHVKKSKLKTVKETEKNLKKDFKNKIKLPSKFKIDENSLVQTDIHNHSNGVQVYDQIYTSKKNNSFYLVRVYSVVPEQNKEGVTFEKMSLSDGTPAEYLDQGNMQKLFFTDKDTGLYYMILAVKDEKKVNSPLKTTKEEMKEIQKSMVKFEKANEKILKK